jgi:hypothetical protein
MLRALRDDHVFPIARHGPVERQITRDREAQLLFARDFAIRSRTACLRAQCVIHAAAPDVEGKQRFVGRAADEVLRRRHRRPRQREALRHLLPQRLRTRGGVPYLVRALAQRLSGLRMRRALNRQALQTIGDEGARTNPRAQIAFGNQALEHVERGLARHAQLRGEIARGRQTRAACEAPLEYPGAQLAINLSGQIVMPFDSDVNVHASDCLNDRRDGFF